MSCWITFLNENVSSPARFVLTCLLIANQDDLTQIEPSRFFRFNDLNLLQPRPASSSLHRERASLVPAAETWAVRPGSPVSEARARPAGLQVSAPQASAGRWAVVAKFLIRHFAAPLLLFRYL